MEMLATIESRFIKERRGASADDHAKVLDKTVKLMTSSQMDAFKVAKEPKDVQERYGNNGFGKGCLMARRLVEMGVPFVEVDLGGWDNHANIFPTLQNQKLPVLDQAMSALVADLADRGLLDDTVVIYTSDHGEMLGERGMWFKFNPYEQSIKVPLIIHAPGAPAARRVGANCSLVDLLPTLLDLLRCGQPSLRWRAAEVVATCVQNNPPVQRVSRGVGDAGGARGQG
jgi:hypothetical protein